MGTTKRCIACAELIQADAKLCKHCQVEQNDKRFLSNGGSESHLDAQVTTEPDYPKSKANALTLKIFGGIAAFVGLMVLISGLMGNFAKPIEVAAEIGDCGSNGFYSAAVIIRNESLEVKNVEVLVAWYSQDGTQVQQSVAAETIGPESEAVVPTAERAKYLYTTCKILETRTY